ncbi:hypothetical protein RI367_001477 [Sorochytrium milnesiophthora]
MGRSAKAMKRATKRQKDMAKVEQQSRPAQKKTSAPPQSFTTKNLKKALASVLNLEPPAAAAAAAAPSTSLSGDVNMSDGDEKQRSDIAPAKKLGKFDIDPSAPDYVDLFSGKKMYKRVEDKRKKKKKTV